MLRHVLGWLLLSVGLAHAAGFPPAALLDELEAQLREPPTCHPACAAIGLLSLNLGDDRWVMMFEVHADARVGIPLPGSQGQWWPNAVRALGETAEPPVLLRDAQGVLWALVGPGIQRFELAGPAPSRRRVDLQLPLRPARVVEPGENSPWLVDGVNQQGVPQPALQIERRQREGEPRAAGRVLEPGVLPPLLQVTRTLQLGLDWRVVTQVRRQSPPGSPLTIALPLLEGEAVTTAGLVVDDGKVSVRFDAATTDVSFTSRLAQSDSIRLTAPADRRWTEEWRMDVAPLWSVSYEGIPAIHHRDGRGAWLPTFLPWPGESLAMLVARPAGVPGPQLTIDRSLLSVVPGQRAVDSELQLEIRASRGQQHRLVLPEAAELRSVTVDGNTQPVRQSGREVVIPVRPGAQAVTLAWRETRPLGWRFETPPVDLGVPSVNHAVSLQMPRDRWSLFLTGPRLGPAVLFWSMLLVVGLLAFGLGRSQLTPLGMVSWALLGIGLTQVPVNSAVLVIFWLLALGVRARMGAVEKPLNHNLLQIGLVFLSLIALSLLFDAVSQGLLGYPSMQISGNDSSAFQLNWYQDRAGNVPDQATVISAPLWVYRAVMLAWALWLAFALLGWLKWGWSVLSRDGLWRKLAINPRGWRIGKGKDAKRADDARPPSMPTD